MRITKPGQPPLSLFGITLSSDSGISKAQVFKNTRKKEDWRLRGSNFMIIQKCLTYRDGRDKIRNPYQELLECLDELLFITSQ